jgi:hypothetical protein
MKQLGIGIGVCGVWLGTAFALANGAASQIVIGSTVSTVALAWALVFTD